MIDNNDSTVTDETSGLMWQQETSKDEMTSEHALEYCENLNLCGYTNWRLPTITELLNLLDYSRDYPEIYSKCFPNKISSFYWCLNHKWGEWGVNFPDGYNRNGHKYNRWYVRAVRSNVN
jgi:hypothetical protein